MSSNRISFSLFTFISLCALTLMQAGHTSAITYDGNAPTAPTSVNAVTQNSPSLRIVISWSQATDNVKVTRYNIYKNGTFLTSPSGVGTTYTDTAIASGQTYTYSVQAGDGDGNNGPQSDTVQIIASSGEVSRIVSPNSLTSNVPTSTPVSTPSVTSYYTSSGYHDDAPQTDHPESVGLIAYDDKMEVIWKNPKGNEFKTVRVIKKETSFPVSVTDGKVICDSIAVISCIDKEVVPKKTYYYGVYAADQSYIASKIINVSGALIEKKTEEVTSQKPAPKPVETVTSKITPQSTLGTDATTTKNMFTKTLQVGSVGQEVLLLQKFLNTHGFVIATSGPGSKGFETTAFGRATQKALQGYQCKRTIVCTGSPAETGYGMVGKTTRLNLNKEL
jgi:hypothetical protein